MLSGGCWPSRRRRESHCSGGDADGRDATELLRLVELCASVLVYFCTSVLLYQCTSVPVYFCADNPVRPDRTDCATPTAPTAPRHTDHTATQHEMTDDDSHHTADSIADSTADNTADSTTDTTDSAEQTVYVRPKGYVEPHPVVERIGDRDLYVGNYRAATAPHRDDTAAQHRGDTAAPHRDDATAPHRDAAAPHRDDAAQHRDSPDFDAVLSVGSDSYSATTHHRPLVDGPETDWPAFAAAVETARHLHRADGSLLVHCKAGISRSVAVLATTLAAAENRSFHDALSVVQAARPHAIPHPALHRLGVIYLAARGAQRAEPGAESDDSEQSTAESDDSEQSTAESNDRR